MRLRPYQIDLVARIGAALAEHRSVLLQLPTGGGKTHIAAHVAGVSAAVGERVWIIAHRREIVGQTSRSMADLGVPHGVVGAGHQFEPEQPVQVCAIGSLTRRADALPTPDLMIWDEAHHVAAKSWAALRARFPEARHLGLSATPARLDGKGLGDFFATLICGPSTAELMEAGHLSPYRFFAPTIPDLRGVGMRAGDYARDQLAARMSGATLVGDVVEHYQRIAPNTRAVVFATSVEASRSVAARFTAAGIPASHIDGATPVGKRDAAIADLEAGRLRILSNVEVFTEGFDLPAIDAVILLRPTRSLSLYRQMVGRGLRTAPGKGATIILDHAGLFYEHDLPDDPVDWSLGGIRKRSGASGDLRLRRCPTCSAVHSFAATCPECGFAYPKTMRTIQQAMGRLREVTKSDRIGDTVPAFAARLGVKPSAVSVAKKRGLPLERDGSIAVAQALEWWKTNGTKTRPPTQEGYESFNAFCKRIGISGGIQQQSLRAREFPRGPNGLVNIKVGLAWIKKHGAKMPRRFGRTNR